jgi:hypothetical protein
VDPITLWILILATGWIIRALVEDGAAAVAAARGHPYVSPRIVRREARQRLALERISAGGSPPLTIVFSEKLANRIANPPERTWLRELREYLALVVADGFEDARVRHEQKRAEKRQERPTADPRRPAPAGEGFDDDIVDAELVDPEPEPSPEPEHDPEKPREHPPPPPPPGPSHNSTPALPAPDPTRKDPSVTNTINGDVGSPSEALAFCERTLDLNTACINEIDVALACLRGAGCGQQFLDIITGGLTAADVFHNAVSGARVRYAKHVLTHADLTSDPDLRNTLQGYLSADKV